MKFAHLADTHIGSWREPKLSNLSTQAFLKAMDMCIEGKMDFILIAGDLFNTSLPGIDFLKPIAAKLWELQHAGIPVYVIAGSHDFSPSGKTMIDVLEAAGLVINIVKGEIIENRLKLNFTIDKKTGAKIAGMLGKKGMLDKRYYEALIRENLEQEDGFKIFMFHTALTEYKPKELANMESAPISFLPNNFDYYAGGHVHTVLNARHPDGKGLVMMPGPLFPANFKELEELRNGGFFVYDDNTTEKVRWQPVNIINVHSIAIDCNGKTAEQIYAEFNVKVKILQFYNTIVTLRFLGMTLSGKVSDIDFKSMFKVLYDKGAFFVMKNTSALTTKEFEEIKIDINSIDDIEQAIVKEHCGQQKLGDMDAAQEEEFALSIMRALHLEKNEDERASDFEERVRQNALSAVRKIIE